MEPEDDNLNPSLHLRENSNEQLNIDDINKKVQEV